MELDVAIGRWWLAATSTFEHVFTKFDQLVMAGNIRELLAFNSMCLHRVYGQAHNQRKPCSWLILVRSQIRTGVRSHVSVIRSYRNMKSGIHRSFQRRFDALKTSFSMHARNTASLREGGRFLGDFRLNEPGRAKINCCFQDV